MARHSNDDADDLLAAWHAHGQAEELFVALRDPMRQAARQGIRRILRRTPDEADVDDAVVKAFKEVLASDSEEAKRSRMVEANRRNPLQRPCHHRRWRPALEVP